MMSLKAHFISIRYTWNARSASHKIQGNQVNKSAGSENPQKTILL